MVLYCVLNSELCFLFQAFIIASTASQEEMKRWYDFRTLLLTHFGYSSHLTIITYQYKLFCSKRTSYCHHSLYFQAYLWTKVLWLQCVCRYREHVVWTDKDLNLKLMRKGLLTRLYVPAVWRSTLNRFYHVLLNKFSFVFFIIRILNRLINTLFIFFLSLFFNHKLNEHLKLMLFLLHFWCSNCFES